MGTNLITTVIGFGLSTAFIVFVCIRLVCSRARWSEAQVMSRAAAVRQPTLLDLELQSEPDQQSQHEIDDQQTVDIAALPMIKYNTGLFSSDEDNQCSICLGEYQEEEVLRLMPICGHNFHLNCVDEWLRRQLTCPICRLPIRDLVEAKFVASSLSGDQALGTGVGPALPIAQGLADHRSSGTGNGSGEVLETVNEHMVYVADHV